MDLIEKNKPKGYFGRFLDCIKLIVLCLKGSVRMYKSLRDFWRKDYS